MYTAVTRHLGHVCETTGTWHCVHSENILSGKAGGPSQQDASNSHNSSLWSSCTRNREGLHGNCLIIFWGLLPQNEVTGLSLESRGPEPCLYTLPSVRALLHSQESGKKEMGHTELSPQRPYCVSSQCLLRCWCVCFRQSPFVA